MSCYFRQNNDTQIRIPQFVQSSTSVVYYDIKVQVAKTEWLVERRYTDFAELHNALVAELALPKKMLPPKKLMGNKQPAFLEERRLQLEKYLQELLVYFRIQLPRVLAVFLCFNKYDIIYLLQDLAKLFHESGDSFLGAKKEYNFSALEVYAISERLSLPCPPENIEHRGTYDFSHVLDFCTQLEQLRVTPVKENCSFGNEYNTVDVPIGRSNIIPKNLCFNLNAFRNIQTLRFYGLSTENIIDIGLLKPTLQMICVHNTTITHVNQVLLCDNVHRNISTDADATSLAACHKQQQTTSPNYSSSTSSSALLNWQNLQHLDLSCNLLTQIDETVRTAPLLHTIVLEQNRIRSIQNLSGLTYLRELSLTANLITDCENWHLELGNLETLNLGQNKLKSLVGLRKLLSLVNLDLSCNLIDDLEEVENVAHLPLLESLRLTGNPLASSVDYRARVLARFHERAPEIYLDSEKGSSTELDTALVLSALRIADMRAQQMTQQ